MQKSLKVRQVCLFFIALLPVTKFFIMPSIVAQIASNDMWISILLNLLLDFITIIFIIQIMKKTEKNLYQILESVFSPKGAKVVLLIYLCFFIIKSIVPVFEHKDYVEHTLYINNPNLLYFLPFFFLSFYFGTKKLRTVGRISDVLFIFTLIGFVLLISLSVNSIDLFAVFPILKNPAKKILLGSYASSNWFGDAVYLLFFVGQVDFNKKDGKKLALCFIIQALITIIFTIVFYCTFSSIAFRQRFALTEISKFTTVINNTGRLDYLGILLMIFSYSFSITIPIYLAVKIANYLFKFKSEYVAPIIINGLLMLITVFLSEHVYTIQKIILTYFSAVFILLANVFPILLFFLTKRENINEKV